MPVGYFSVVVISILSSHQLFAGWVITSRARAAAVQETFDSQLHSNK